MKKLTLVVAFFLFQISFAQISTTRMNEIRIKNTLSEVEKALGQKLEISKKLDDWLYKVTINDKGTEFQLSFTEYTDESGKQIIELYEVSTQSKSIKTLSKLGVGSSIDDLWKAYKDYNISIWNSWDEKTEKYSTTERTFQLHDYDAGTALYFQIRNGVVYEISLSFFEGC